MVQTAITAPKINESLFFLIFIRCIKLEITGNRLDKSLNLVWRRFKLCLCDERCSLVSIAMLIWSLIRLWELEVHQIYLIKFYRYKDWDNYLFRCELSLRNISLLLSPEDGPADVLRPDPLSSSSLSIRVVWFAWIFKNSCL